MSEKVPHEVVTAFAELFVGCRKPYGEETGDGWQTRHSELSDELIAAHLDGVRTFGVRPGQQRAHFIALEVDLTAKNVLEARDRVLGEEGFRTWAAIRTASVNLGIPPVHWTASYSGNRSLHFWGLLEEAIPYRAAYRIAQALQQLASHEGARICTAFPTNGTSGGQFLRLPCGRHRRTLVHAHFVDLGLFELRPRPHFAQDCAFLRRVADSRIPLSVLEEAAANAQELLSRTLPEAGQSEKTAQRKAFIPARVDALDPFLTITLGRPCIADVIAKGAPEGHRHAVGHLVRTELKASGLSLKEARPHYLRYARACSPVWPEDEALRDLESNWGVTDIAQRHSCRGSKPTTVFLREHYCKGSLTCLALRKEGFERVWGAEGLSANSRVLYAALCKLEADFMLRPGDAIHTTMQQLAETAGLTERTFKTARQELKAFGLIAWHRTSRGRGAGIHSLYRRSYPVPIPRAKMQEAQEVGTQGREE